MKTKKILLTVSVLASFFWINSAEGQNCNVFAYDSTFFNCPASSQVYLNVFDQQGNIGYVIHWGDGQTTSSNGSSFATYNHVYGSPGIYFPYLILSCGDTVIPQLYDLYSSSNYYNYYYISDSCYTITGKAYVDNNNNCVYDNGDSPLAGLSVNALQNSFVVGTAITDMNGNYTINVGSGNFNISLPNVPASLTLSCGSQNPAGVAAGQSYDFVFNCNGSGHDLKADIYVPAFTQTTTTYVQFTVTNQSCTSVNSDITITLPSQTYISGTISANLNGNPYTGTPSINNNTVTFSGVSMTGFATFYGYIPVKADTTTQLWDTLCAQIAALPTTGDLNPANNNDNICALVLTSYDPNMKSVHINGMPAEGYIDNNQVMEYTIKFQNEGNYPAKDIRIEDVLDVNTLDLSTFELMGSSHNVNVLMQNNKIVFYFPNIWLPDKNSNEPESHGYVKFKINQKPGLAPNTQIKNTADIYFDYNPAVTTNTVTSIIKSPNNVIELDKNTLKIYPNPASDVINVLSQDQAVMRVVLYNSLGQPVMESAGQGLINFDVNHLPAGYYFVRVEKGSNVETIKVMLQK
ncbi:MAG: hypothetical protein KatS3mg034_1178 [Vicingaceae bacterium]|nr:MAG: hypothetical protein KatS3mg034_1178 [Vicingaceae bacterium]